jgi:hypothetical protein
MVAALLHNSVNPDAVCEDLDAIAAANARGHRMLGQVSCCPLSMDFTLASPYPGRRPGELEAGARALGPALETVLADPTSATRCAPSCHADDLSPLQQRMAQGPGRRDARAGLRASSSARSPRSPPSSASTRSTRCSTSRSTTA